MTDATETYRINAKNQLVINKDVTLDGTWSLTPDHDLCLNLDASKDNGFGDKVVLSGKLKDATPNSLTFEVSHHEDTDKIETNIVELQGIWKADDHNKLIFKASKESGCNDVLTLNNTWIIDDKNRIIYNYEKASLIFKKKETHQLVFKGTWDITKENRLYYELGDSTDLPTSSTATDSLPGRPSTSGFEFSVGASVLEKNQVKAKIMIGATEKEISLTGQWKVSKDLGLTFEVDYGDNEFKPITFGGELQLNDKDKLTLKLGKGVDVKLTQDILDGKADFFTALHSDKDDSTIQFGFGIKF